MASRLEPEVTLPWLVRLRWLIVAGQTAALVIALVRHLALQPVMFAAVIVVGAVSNLWLMHPVGRRTSSVMRMGLAVVIDVGLLTCLLAASGGVTNPFTVLYLVYITLSAVVLTARWTTAVSLLSVAGYGVLFLLPTADPVGHHHHHATTSDGFGTHLEGMWLAFLLAAALTGFFVRRISQAIAFQREQIATLRETSARNARLAAVTTLAAGAAHELGSPLQTIAVAAHEAHRAIGQKRGEDALADDLRLILLEVDRCQDILHRLAARAGQETDEERPIDLDDLVEQIRTDLGPERANRVDVRVAGNGRALVSPRGPLVQSLVALIRNALDAGPEGARVAVGITTDEREFRIEVVDRGQGIDPAVLARIGEPFFTTKQPGRGLGLGVYLARAFIESRGGTLRIESSPGIGTRALINVPLPSGGSA